MRAANVGRISDNRGCDIKRVVPSFFIVEDKQVLE